MQTFWLKQQIDHLFNYTVVIANPRQLKNTVKGLGERLAYILETPGHYIEHTVAGIEGEAENFLHNLISGPVQWVLIEYGHSC